MLVRGNTFLEEEVIISSSSISTSKLVVNKESESGSSNHGSIHVEVIDELAAGCIGSSKHRRPGYSGGDVNEDKIVMRKTVLSNGEEALFVGVFDGHGGKGCASQFVANNILSVFLKNLEQLHNSNNNITPKKREAALAVEEQERDASDQTANEQYSLEDEEDANARYAKFICQALERSFVEADEMFYSKISVAAGKLKETKASNCKCVFFLENPCPCLHPPISANEGSTGTVALITKEKVFVANIGDSDSYIVSLGESDAKCDDDVESSSPSFPPAGKRHKLEESSGGSGSSSSSSSSNNKERVLRMEKVTVTDTPLKIDSSEDYQRIKAIALERASGNYSPSSSLLPAKAAPLARTNNRLPTPPDGILQSSFGTRYNYVSLPGARCLNMVRAFGNFGHKHFVDDSLVEYKSPIISRPHLCVVKRTSEMLAFIVASDGLWDNIKEETVKSILHSNGRQEPVKITEKLIKTALKSNAKPDDVSLVFVSLKHNNE